MTSTFIFVFEIATTALIAAFLGTTVYAAVIGGPFQATPKKALRKALELAQLKPGEKFYDLGCGNGRSLVIAAQEFGATAVGYELSLQHYLLAKLNIATHRLGKRARVIFKNLYTAPVGDADVVFLWITPRAFRKLEDKIKTEFKSGVRVVTFSSPLMFWKPERVVRLKGEQRLFLYRTS